MTDANFSTELIEQRAHQHYQKKHYRDAATLFLELSLHYASLNEIGKTAEMKNNASVAWLLAGEAQQALDAAKDTHLQFESLHDEKQAGMAYGNQAAAYDALHDFESALSFYQKASEKLAVCGEKEYKAMVLKEISQLQLKTGEHLQALASMNTALDSTDKLSGKEKFLKRFLRKIFH
jgi:tetratricopeptide (TPR) repeat protein